MLTQKILDVLSEEVERFTLVWDDAVDKECVLRSELYLAEQEAKTAEKALEAAKNSFKVFEAIFNTQRNHQEDSLNWIKDIQTPIN